MSETKSWYQWVILAAGFLLMAVPFSMINTIHSLFLYPVTNAYGFSISAFSFIFTLSAIVIAVASPIIGKLLSRYPIKLIMTVCSLMAGLGFLSYTFCTHIYQFYLAAVVTAIGLAGITTIPISTMLTGWFETKRGTAMGIAFAGAGSGTFFWMQLVSRVLERHGFHYAYVMMGIIILCVTIPISLFIVKKAPAQAMHNNQAAAVDGGKKAGQLQELRQKPAFWPFALGLIVLGVAISGTQVHVQPYLVFLGYPLGHNANVGSTLALSALIGSIIGGLVFDKMSFRKSVVFFGLLNLVALACLYFANINGLPFVFAVSFGICLCLPSLLPAYGTGKLFGKENYAYTLGIFNGIFVLGGALGPFLSGLVADSPLGYGSAWILYFILAICYLFFFVRAIRVAAKPR